jgi:hypothetical protein
MRALGFGLRLILQWQHARRLHVGAEIGPASHLVDAVGADRAGADDFQRKIDNDATAAVSTSPKGATDKGPN